MQVGWRVGAQPVGATQNRSFPAPLNWPRTETGLNLAGEGRSAYTASWNRRGKTEIPVECLPFGPASCSASRSNSSPSALSPTCWTHSNSACLLRAIPSIIGSNSCCAANSRPPPACLASRLFALFLIGGSFPPRGRCCWHDPFSGRPGAAATYSDFNIRGDIAGKRAGGQFWGDSYDRRGRANLANASQYGLQGVETFRASRLELIGGSTRRACERCWRTNPTVKFRR